MSPRPRVPARPGLVIALLGLLTAGLSPSCAHGPGGGGPDPRATVDVVLPGGGVSTLRAIGGDVTVLDICAGWSAPCLENARALSEACDVLCGEKVGVVSMLLDEQGQSAVHSYYDVLGVGHTVVLAGPSALAGHSALGSVLDIPRLIIFDADGTVVEDEVGGVVSALGIIKRVRARLD